MKANQNSRQNHDDRAEVGIGTMIVFIAAVIVAAIAAAVLVNTAGNLQRKAQETGEETTNEVSGNIFVRDVVAHVNSDPDIDDLNVTIALAPGAESLDLTNLVVRFQNETTLDDLTYDEDGDSNAGDINGNGEGDCDQLSQGFCLLNVKEADGGTADTTLESGDRVHLHVGFAGTEELVERNEVNLLLIPETGAPTEVGFKTPSSLTDKTFVVLS